MLRDKGPSLRETGEITGDPAANVLAAVDEFSLAGDTPHRLQDLERGANALQAVLRNPIFTGP